MRKPKNPNRPPKTIDTDYLEAKYLFFKTIKDTKELQHSIQLFIDDVEKISKLSVAMSKNVARYFSTSRNPSLISQGQTMAGVGENVQNQTNSYLKTKFDTFVMKPFNTYQKEIDRIKGLREKLKGERLKYDTSKQSLLQMQNFKIPLHQLNQMQENLANSFSKYNQTKNDFIKSVHAIVAAKKQYLDTPLQNMSNILGDYLKTVQASLLPLKNVFPMHAFPQQIPNPYNQNPYQQPPFQQQVPSQYPDPIFPPSNPYLLPQFVPPPMPTYSENVASKQSDKTKIQNTGSYNPEGAAQYPYINSSEPPIQQIPPSYPTIPNFEPKTDNSFLPTYPVVDNFESELYKTPSPYSSLDNSNATLPEQAPPAYPIIDDDSPNMEGQQNQDISPEASQDNENHSTTLQFAPPPLPADFCMPAT